VANGRPRHAAKVSLTATSDALAAELEGKVFWEKPLYEARQ